MCIGVLADEGDNILLPCPGFPLYEVFCKYKGIEARHYNLIADENWEIDFDHLISLIDENTKSILLNNPSNPCGSVLSKSQLLKLLQGIVFIWG